MSSFEDREKKRSVVASMISETSQERTVCRGRPKEERETKQRISLVVLPSLYEDIKKIAYVERRSVSELVSTCIEQYVSENEAKLKEYDKIRKD